LNLNPTKLLRTHKLRGLLVAGVMAAGVTGLVMNSAPAHADPSFTMVAVGSDTIQDVYNQFASNLGGTTLASYNALNPVTQQSGDTLAYIDGSSNTSCDFPRPNGSTPGLDALEASVGGTIGSGGVSPAPGAGCVDIARSSAGPNAAGSGPAGGSFTGANAIQFVPFAEDAVDGAVGPATSGTPFTAESHDAAGDTLPATTVATALPLAAVDDFTQTDLTDLYADCEEVTVGGTVFWPLGDTVSGQTTQPSGSQQIDLYIPQLGSGTEKFWASALGFSATTPPACVNTSIVNGALAPNASDNPTHIVFSDEEHDGTNIATDPDGYAPFSIAQWISQSNGHNDRRHGAQLADLVDSSGTQQVPTQTRAGVTEISSAFPAPFTRLVYSVVSLSRLQNTSDPLNNFLDATTSTICKSSSTMISYGFSPLTGNANILGGATCGEITAPLEAAP
jgi:hypothetical protein